MASDDLDVEAMLEAPYKREENGKENSSKDSSRRRSRSRSRGRRRSDKRSRSRDRDRDRDRKKRSSRDREREKDTRRKSPERRRERRRTRSRSRDKRRERRKRSPPLTPEERDARTVICMQLSQRIKSRDLEEFFSSVGKVKEVKLITDNKTGRSKGIAYVEFREIASVALGLGLSGQKLLGVPIQVNQSQAERNRAPPGPPTMTMYRGPNQPASVASISGNSGPIKLYVGSLHFNITEDMLKGIFEPFGKIDAIQLVKEPETRKSKGFGFVTFRSSEDGMKAMQQLNGFELAGRAMKVGLPTERTEGRQELDTDEVERRGLELTATGRVALMAKLAEGTGFQLPQSAQNALMLQDVQLGALQTQAAAAQAAPAIATQCFMLSNMFDPNTENNPNFEVEIRDDVIEECNKHGGVLHIYVDKASAQGNVYVKCPSIASAVASVNALHGRWFAGKMITAAYVPLPDYHRLFNEAFRAYQLLMPSGR